MSDIFISHSRHDADFADYLRAKCMEAGLTVFVDRHDINQGEHWFSRLQDESRNAGSLWLLASNEAINSRMVNHEIAWAKAADVPVIPILWNMTPECLPVDLQGIQALVLTNKSEQEAIAGIDSLINKAASKKQSDRFTNGVAVLIGAALGWLILKKSN